MSAVLVRRRRAVLMRVHVQVLSRGLDREPPAVVWPEDWPLPRMGELVGVPGWINLEVVAVYHDLGLERIEVVLRPMQT